MIIQDIVPSAEVDDSKATGAHDGINLIEGICAGRQDGASLECGRILQWSCEGRWKQDDKDIRVQIVQAAKEQSQPMQNTREGNDMFPLNSVGEG